MRGPRLRGLRDRTPHHSHYPPIGHHVTPATRTIPIIVLTSMEVDEDVQQHLGTTVSGLMSKSRFTKKDLLREITNVENARWP